MLAGREEVLSTENFPWCRIACPVRPSLPRDPHRIRIEPRNVYGLACLVDELAALDAHERNREACETGIAFIGGLRLTS